MLNVQQAPIFSYSYLPYSQPNFFNFTTQPLQAISPVTNPFVFGNVASIPQQPASNLKRKRPSDSASVVLQRPLSKKPKKIAPSQENKSRMDSAKCAAKSASIVTEKEKKSVSQPLSNRTLKVVIDAPCLLNNLLDIVNFEKQSQICVVIPRVVVDELDEGKKEASGKGNKFRTCIRILEDVMKRNLDIPAQQQWMRGQALNESVYIGEAGKLSKEERIIQCALYLERNRLSFSKTNLNKESGVQNVDESHVLILSDNPTLLLLAKQYNLHAQTTKQFLSSLPPVYHLSVVESKKSLK